MLSVKTVGSYFANHKYASLSYSETDDVAYWVIKHVNINHPAFKHKGAPSSSRSLLIIFLLHQLMTRKEFCEKKRRKGGVHIETSHSHTGKESPLL